MSRVKYVDMLSDDFRAWIEERVTAEGDCWVWRLSLKDGSQPQGKFNGSIINVRRLVLEQTGRAPVPRAEVAACRCDTPGCVHPNHLKPQSRSELLKGLDFSLTHRANLAKARRAKASLNLEQVLAIRASEKSLREISAEFGISESHAGGIVRGRFWKEYTSPFAGLGAR